MIAVLGPGGVGGLVAAALAGAGENVVVIAHEDTAQTIARRGIRVSSVLLGDFTAYPRAVPRLEEAADVLVLATKATTLANALTRVVAVPRIVVPLLNGIDHIAALRARYEWVTASVIRVESDRPEPGVVVQTSPRIRIDLSPDWPAVRVFASELERAGIPTRVSDDEATVLWTKLVRLTALALATSAHDLPLGPIRSTPELFDELRALVRECAAVARAEGADLAADAVLAELTEAHPGAGSSMRRDLAAGRPPELDAIAGAVLRATARHDLDAPTVARLADRVRARAG